jgi:hypothetical protein
MHVIVRLIALLMLLFGRDATIAENGNCEINNLDRAIVITSDLAVFHFHFDPPSVFVVAYQCRGLEITPESVTYVDF